MALSDMSTAGSTLAYVDISGSMELPCGPGTRHEQAGLTVQRLAPNLPGARWFAFNDDVVAFDPVSRLRYARGGTDLARALRHGRQYRPDRVLVVCDGEPDDEEAALREALLLNCRIDVAFVGDETNQPAIRFMNRLAGCSRKGTIGTAKTISLAKPEQAAEEILRLAGPGG
jgi:hypothetical protein